MGNRKRVGTHSSRLDTKVKLNAAKKEFTRGKALHALANGADFNDKKFVTHRNYHVRERAWQMAGAVVPENMAERKALFDTLARGRSIVGLELLKDRFGYNADNVVEENAAAA